MEESRIRVAVVGAEGFIGSHVMEELTNMGHESVGFDYNVGTYATEYLDVTLPKNVVWALLESSHADAVIGLAGLLGTHELFDRVEDAIKVNVLGQYNVAHAAMRMGVPYVTIEQPHIWTNPYEATRGAGVRLARSLAFHRGLHLATVEAFNAYGPRQATGPGHPQKIVPTFARAAWQGQPIEIYGDGTQMVNLVSARQVATVMIEAIRYADSSAPHFLGAAMGGNFTVNQVAHMVQVWTDHWEKIKHLPMREGETDDRLGAAVSEYELRRQPLVPSFVLSEFHDTIDYYKP